MSTCRGIVFRDSHAITDWQPWFAWFPVRVGQVPNLCDKLLSEPPIEDLREYRRTWLKFLMRRKVWSGGISSCWEYKKRTQDEIGIWGRFWLWFSGGGGDPDEIEMFQGPLIPTMVFAAACAAGVLLAVAIKLAEKMAA